VADPGADLVFEAPGGPPQDVARVVAGVQHGLSIRVALPSDGASNWPAVNGLALGQGSGAQRLSPLTAFLADELN
jgi:hypothetical protein